MCGGDGLADIVGRRYGSAKLPFNHSKSWVGSLAMFTGKAGAVAWKYKLTESFQYMQSASNRLHCSFLACFLPVHLFACTRTILEAHLYMRHVLYGCNHC